MNRRRSPLSSAALCVLLVPLALWSNHAGAQSRWQDDAPGRTHRIDVAKLPAPFATPSARDFPTIQPKPGEASLKLPPGFKIDVFTRDVDGPRVMRVAPNGDIFVAETGQGRIKVLKPSTDGASVASSTVYATGLTRPFGMQFYPAGATPQWLYVAEMNRVVRYPYKSGDGQATGEPEVVVSQLAPTGEGHYTRDLVFSPDGRRMFVAVGSLSNVAEDMPKKSADEIKA